MTSDVADEIHVHGYDLKKDVPAGGSVRFSFPASIEGVFEIELEGRKPTDRAVEGLALMRTSRAAALVAAVTASALVAPDPAAAHGLVGRADLPIPYWLFGWAAAVVLIVSFAGLATLWQTPKLEPDDGFRPAPEGLSFTLVNPATEFFAGLVGVALLGVTIWAGLAGVQAPQANFTPTFIYVIFWVGLVPVSILFGDVFRALNPWRAIARAAGFVASRISGPMPRPFAYPEWLGRWPAAAGLLGFAWMELSYRNGSDPSTLAIAALVYSAITLLAIACFGTEAWISRARRSRSTTTCSRGSRPWW